MRPARSSAPCDQHVGPLRLVPIADIDRLVAVGAHDRVHPHDSPTQTPASARGSRNSQVMGAVTSNPPNLVAGVGWHQQQPLISAHRLPHRGSGIQFSDNLATRRSRRASVLRPFARSAARVALLGEYEGPEPYQPKTRSAEFAVITEYAADEASNPTRLGVGPSVTRPRNATFVLWSSL